MKINSSLGNSGGFFQRSHKPLLVGFTLLILASAPVARPLQGWLRAQLGREGMMILLGGMFLGAALAGGFLINIRKLPRRNLILSSLLFLVGLAGSLALKIPEERIHLLEYGLLGILAPASLSSKNGGGNYLRALLFIFLVGLLDEGFQWLLPDRVGDWRDICFNSLGGIWGIALYWALSGGTGRLKAASGKRSRY